MATFTDGMRLGEARKTSLATLALGVAMEWFAPEGADAAHPTTGERTVSGVRISLGEVGRRWTLVPTLLDGKVESFLALREDMPMGGNLTAVWYRKVAAADGTASWESRAFTDQDQSKAVRAVKEALSLADSTDESWPVAVAEVAAAGLERLVRGVLETDALAPLVAELADPKPIVEMLEDTGWKTAWVGPLEAVAPGLDPSTVEPETDGCPQAVVLDALEGIALRWDAEVPSSISIEDLACVAVGAYPICTTEGPAQPWIPSVGWDCGPWTLETMRTPLHNCETQCNYTREVSRRRFRKITEWHCYTGTVLGSYHQTQYETGDQSASLNVPGAATPVQLQGSCNFVASCPVPPVFAAGENPTCGPSGGTTVGPWLDP